jgi:TrmH family RNA methyltransferase
VVVELFATGDAIERHRELLSGHPVAQVSEKDVAALSQTQTPQGLVAVCRTVDVSLADALSHRPRLVAALVEPNDPGNAGTILRTADAAGAGAVVVAGGVDIYNGKAVRASAGSLFHLDVVVEGDPEDLIEAAHDAGLTVLATTGRGGRGVEDLDELADSGSLALPSMWLFGSEAHGLAPTLIAAADRVVRVPIHGSAESLNLAAAAAVCLYASARAQRNRTDPAP